MMWQSKKKVNVNHVIVKTCRGWLTDDGVIKQFMTEAAAAALPNRWVYVAAGVAFVVTGRFKCNLVWEVVEAGLWVLLHLGSAFLDFWFSSCCSAFALPSSSEEDIGFSLVDFLFFFFPFVKQISKGVRNMRNSVWIPDFQ